MAQYYLTDFCVNDYPKDVLFGSILLPRDKSVMKLLTLSSILVFAFLFTSPPHHCHGLEHGAANADQCQGCLFSTASSAVLEKSNSSLPDRAFVGFVAAAPETGYPQVRNAQHLNRAPPLP